MRGEQAAAKKTRTGRRAGGAKPAPPARGMKLNQVNAQQVGPSVPKGSDRDPVLAEAVAAKSPPEEATPPASTHFYTLYECRHVEHK